MKRKNVIIIAAASVCLLASFCIYFSAAYLVSSPAGADNEIIIGYDKIEVEEDFDPPDEQKSDEAVCYKKKVTIKNTGDTPCYVRVFADFSSSEIRSLSAFSYDQADDGSPQDKTYYSAEMRKENGYFIEEVSKESNPNKGWVYVTEIEDADIGGYYYYTKILAEGEETPPLFTYVKTDYSGNKEAQQYDLIVYSESVQIVTKDGSSATGEDRYKEVWKDYLVNYNV